MDVKAAAAVRSEHASAEAAALFGELFAVHHAYVHRSVMRLGVPARDAEDVTHDVFVVVHRKLAGFDRARPAKPWLFAIAARVTADFRRLARHRHEWVDATLEQSRPAPEGERADAQLEARDARAFLIAALQAVAEERRPVLVMVDLDEMSVPEVADALEIPLNTAYSRLRLAREELAAAVHRMRARGGAR